MTRTRRAPPAPPARARTSRIDVLLALAADPSAESTSSRLRWLRRTLLAWGAVRTLVWTSLDAPLHAGTLTLTAIVLATAAALAWIPRYERWASRVAVPAVFAQLLATLPLTPNHFFLELYAVTILACTDGSARDDGLALAGVRWLTAIVLFLTGCQKLAYGHYLHGDFLAFMVGRGDRFADLFAWVLPPSEVVRLASYDPFRGGSGPYRVTAAPFVLMSNAVWLAELALPVGLLVPRTRTLAALGALAFVAAIQLGARELGFALLFMNLLALFAPPALARVVAGASLAGLIGIVAAALGIVPGAALVRAWHLW